MRSREQELARVGDMCKIECRFWREHKLVAGIDEVGRGPLAGPVVTACVIMPPEPILLYINDSKKVSAKRREALYDQIHEVALDISIGQADRYEIDAYNILNATKLAMVRAVEGLKRRPDHLLIDALRLDVDIPQTGLVHGDAISYSIAAASIIAKVYRDRMMAAYESVYPGYGFAQHKGYGTAQHRHAIRTLGVTPLHRESFLTKLLP